jgi:hypothetical protein
MSDDILKERDVLAGADILSAGSHREFELIVNKKPHKWKAQFITGAEIKRLAESPSDWVVNQLIDGPGEDPEIGDSQKVDLDPKSRPLGVKKFSTRKPTTSPGC